MTPPSTLSALEARLAALEQENARLRAAEQILRPYRDKCRSMEAELLTAKQLESIAALSGGIAHDYNNLLTAIMGNITLVRTRLDTDTKSIALLDQAYKATLVAKDLTQRLITFSKGGTPSKAVVAVAPLIQRAVDFTLSGSDVACRYMLKEDLWCVEVDQTQIGQAIHNIVVNALEAMPQGGRLDVMAENQRVANKQTMLKPGQYVCVHIADHGGGISAEHLDQVFVPYFSTKVRGSNKGTGLGLSIAHSIIRQHGGHIQVESQIKRGTTFTLYLPATRQSPTPLTQAPDCDTAHQIVAEHPSILVMDDEPMIRDLAGEILTHLGCQVKFANNGEEALALYQAAFDQGRPFDAVILDLTIRGGMGGRETMRRLLQLDPGVKAIVSSGYSEDPVMTDYRQFGFSGAAAKPYSLEDMQAALHRVLSLKSSSAPTSHPT
jgi:signal transduction histidine kinase/CheY-like chemotaxis protein